MSRHECHEPFRRSEDGPVIFPEADRVTFIWPLGGAFAWIIDGYRWSGLG